MKVIGFASVVALALAATEAAVVATTVNDVPEIAPGSLSAGLGLLAAGVLVLRSRFRRK